MTAPTRAAVWLDHHQARVFHIDLDSFDERRLQAPQHRFHRHAKGASEPHEHPDAEASFYEQVAQALASADDILLLGPSTAKSQFVKYLGSHARAIADNVVGVETSDHPTDAQIVAHVRSHFRMPEPRMR
jgi:stalled ribosome rescue protein Dom34